MAGNRLVDQPLCLVWVRRGQEPGERDLWTRGIRVQTDRITQHRCGLFPIPQSRGRYPER